jgi:hypothetical protein
VYIAACQWDELAWKNVILGGHPFMLSKSGKKRDGELALVIFNVHCFLLQVDKMHKSKMHTPELLFGITKIPHLPASPGAP